MDRVVIVLLVVVSIVWRIAPEARPVIDVAIWNVAASLMFVFGVRLEAWLTRW